MTDIPLKPGLYIVATPIGNLKDITLRGLETLSACDVIYCEDTRVSIKLLNHYGIKKQLLTYHEHNADKVRISIIERLLKNERVCLISDAGTPLISDPGYKLIRECYKHKIYVSALPGACALINGLVLSGLPTDHFLFAGFAKKEDFEALQYIPFTLVFYVSPHKLLNDLKTMAPYFNDRDIVTIREITKMFEEVRSGTFEELIDYYENNAIKGEFVLVLGPKKKVQESDVQYEAILRELLKTMSLNEAAKTLSKEYKLPKKMFYEMGLSLKETQRLL
jgi:16S rRNA (cytidine1402-2'-O)-methyltransferase